MLYKKSTKMYSILYIVAIIIFLSLFSNIALATYTIFDNVNITKNLTVMGLNAADCDVKANTSGFLYCGIDVTGGGGSGTNYWQVSSTWMFPNITAGGKNLVNVTTLNATTLNQNGYKVLDISGGITLSNITDVANCSAGQVVTGKVGSSWVCTSDLFNTSAQMKAAVNDTADAYYQIVSKNSTGLSCTDCLSGAQISELTDADINNAITVSGAVWVNSSTGMKASNNTKIYFGTEGEYCMFYNSTLGALVTTNVC